MSNWKIVFLGELLTESKIESESPNTQKRIRVKLNVGGVEKRPDTNDKEGATKYFVRKQGQFIYGKQNLHKGAFGIVPDVLDGYESSSDIPAFDVHDSCYPEWIFYFFKQNKFYLKLESLAKGVGSKRIQAKDLYALKISLPSKDQQQKILKEVRIFEQNVDRLNKEFSYQFALINKLKNISTNEAIQGKLTEKWRDNDSDNGIKLNAISKDVLSESINIPFEIPTEWCWHFLGDVMLKITDGTHHSPHNGATGDYKYITAKNIKNDGIVLDNITYVTKEIHKEIYARCNPQKGDILYIKDGATTGICCINEFDEEFSMLSSVALLKPPPTIFNKFLLLFLQSSFYYNYIRAGMTGIAITRVTLKKLKESLIPVPSLKEQLVIVEKLNDLLQQYQRLEKQIELNKENTELLSNSVLSEVFGNNINIIQNNVKGNFHNNKDGNLASFNAMVEFNKNNFPMNIEQILLENGKMSAVALWKMSDYHDNIDRFYEELKKLVEIEKKVVESEEKGFLELVK